MTPVGTSNELDAQNKWEENTHTHTWLTCLKKNQNAPRPSEHPPVRPFLTRKFFQEILGLEGSQNFLGKFRQVHNLKISDRLLRSKSFFQENIPDLPICSPRTFRENHSPNIYTVNRRNQPTATDLYFLDWVRTRYKTEPETHTKSAHTVL